MNFLACLINISKMTSILSYRRFFACHRRRISIILRFQGLKGNITVVNVYHYLFLNFVETISENYFHDVVETLRHGNKVSHGFVQFLIKLFQFGNEFLLYLLSFHYGDELVLFSFEMIEFLHAASVCFGSESVHANIVGLQIHFSLLEHSVLVHGFSDTFEISHFNLLF